MILQLQGAAFPCLCDPFPIPIRIHPYDLGAPANDQDFMFLNNVTDLIEGGRNITHVLGFNEPDGPWSQGGSNMTVSSAVQSWLREVAPLQQMGIKAGAPVVTQGGFSWLADFMTE